MKKHIIVVILGLVVCTFIGITVNAKTVNAPLGQSDIIALSKPSIVKIYHQTGGKLTIPTIKLDVRTMTLSVDENYTASPKTTYVVSPSTVISYKFDHTIDPDTIYGTGFVVSPDGYIVTNAHVASEKYLQQDLLAKIEQNLIDEMISAYDDKYPNKLDIMYPSSDEWTKIYDELDTVMLKLITDNSKLESQLVVIPQSSTDTNLDDILRDGLPATVVSIMDDLATEKNQDKDLAVIKIEQNNLPALKIDNTNSAQVGQKIFIWGYPANAEFSEKDVIDPTLTAGIINAFKDSSDKSFKLIQTDAKISEGSSGSPILNEKGEVVGIVTYGSFNDSDSGDSFGWGLPSSFILEVMKNGSVTNNTNYYDKFSAGINFLNNKRCKKANDSFNSIKNTNEKFPVNSSIQPYIDRCSALISAGQSIDSIWAEAWIGITEFFAKYWLIVIIALLGFAGLITAITMLRKQNVREEAEIDMLKNTIAQNNKSVQPQNPPQNNTPPTTPPPALPPQ